MKKAVGYLIPFMEIEREENNKKLLEQGLQIDENVSNACLLFDRPSAVYF